MLPWITALRVFNKGSPSWCIPRKGTVGYDTVNRIRQGQEVKTPKQIMDELERKTVGKPKTERRSATISLDVPTMEPEKPKPKRIRAKVPVSPKKEDPTALRKEKKDLTTERESILLRLATIASDIKKGDATEADRKKLGDRAKAIVRRIDAIDAHLAKSDPKRDLKEKRARLNEMKKIEDRKRATLATQAVKIEKKKTKTEEDLKKLADIRKQQDIHISAMNKAIAEIAEIDRQMKK